MRECLHVQITDSAISMASKESKEPATIGVSFARRAFAARSSILLARQSRNGQLTALIEPLKVASLLL